MQEFLEEFLADFFDKSLKLFLETYLLICPIESLEKVNMKFPEEFAIRDEIPVRIPEEATETVTEKNEG